MGVSGCTHYLKDTAAHFHNGDIQRASAEIKYENLHVFFCFVQPKSQGCRSRLVNNPDYVKSCNRSSVLGCLTLVIIKVCWNSDYGFFYWLPNKCLSVFFYFLQNERGDLLRFVFLVLNPKCMIRPHLSLGCYDGRIRVCHGLPPCRFPYQQITGFGKRNNRWERLSPHSYALGSRYDCRFTAHYNRRGRITRSKINTDYFSHFIHSFLKFPLTTVLLQRYEKYILSESR